MEASLQTLDTACISVICLALDARSVAALQCVSRSTRLLASEDTLWRDLCCRDWELAEARTPSGEATGSYRRVCAHACRGHAC